MKQAGDSVSAMPNASRRRFVATVSSLIGGVSILNLLPCSADADEPAHLSPEDPVAKALHYTEDASTATAATHAPGSACANCNFFQGGTAAFGPCQLFQGKTVSAKGWCAGYLKKS
jgi:hypothetical protein